MLCSWVLGGKIAKSRLRDDVVQIFNANDDALMKRTLCSDQQLLSSAALVQRTATSAKGPGSLHRSSEHAYNGLLEAQQGNQRLFQHASALTADRTVLSNGDDDWVIQAEFR
jgi:hypothetical protein